MKKGNCKSACTSSCPCQCVRPKRRMARTRPAPRPNPIAQLLTAYLTQKIQEKENKQLMYKPEMPMLQGGPSVPLLKGPEPKSADISGINTPQQILKLPSSSVGSSVTPGTPVSLVDSPQAPSTRRPSVDLQFKSFDLTQNTLPVPDSAALRREVVRLKDIPPEQQITVGAGETFPSVKRVAKYKRISRPFPETVPSGRTQVPGLVSVLETLQEATDKASAEGEQKVDFS